MGKLTELVKKAFGAQAEATSETSSSATTKKVHTDYKASEAAAESNFTKLAEDLRKIAMALPDDFDIGEQKNTMPSASEDMTNLTLRDLLAQYAIPVEEDKGEEVQNE